MKILLRIASVLYLLCGIALIPLGLYCNWLTKEAGTAIIGTEDINGFLPNADSLPGVMGDLLSNSGLAILCSLCIVLGALAILIAIFGFLGSCKKYIPLATGHFFAGVGLVLSVISIILSFIYSTFNPYMLLALITPLLYIIGATGMKKRINL